LWKVKKIKIKSYFSVKVKIWIITFQKYFVYSFYLKEIVVFFFRIFYYCFILKIILLVINIFWKSLYCFFDRKTTFIHSNWCSTLMQYKFKVAKIEMTNHRTNLNIHVNNIKWQNNYAGKYDYIQVSWILLFVY